MIILNLALPKRTCSEPLASTHPDRQGSRDALVGVRELGRLQLDRPERGARWVRIMITTWGRSVTLGCPEVGGGCRCEFRVVVGWRRVVWAVALFG
jgi:hypothetical protein